MGLRAFLTRIPVLLAIPTVIASQTVPQVEEREVDCGRTPVRSPDVRLMASAIAVSGETLGFDALLPDWSEAVPEVGRSNHCRALPKQERFESREACRRPDWLPRTSLCRAGVARNPSFLARAAQEGPRQEYSAVGTSIAPTRTDDNGVGIEVSSIVPAVRNCTYRIGARACRRRRLVLLRGDRGRPAPADREDERYVRVYGHPFFKIPVSTSIPVDVTCCANPFPKEGRTVAEGGLFAG